MNQTNTVMLAILVALATTSILVTALSMMSQQTALAIPDNANNVGKFVNNNGQSPNGQVFAGCKQTFSAKECATGDLNNGEFTSGLAHFSNGPP
jgi:hypothetical protein